MNDVIQLIRQCLRKKEAFAMATVLKTWGSSPRKMGAHMVVSQSGQIAGSVSGGCVEGDLAQKAQEVIEISSAQLIHYGVTNEDAWQVGLSCGGKIDVYVEPFLTENVVDKDHQLLSDMVNLMEAKKTGALIRKIGAEDAAHFLMHDEVPTNDNFIKEAYELSVKEKRHQLITDDQAQQYFVEILMPQSKVILIGASHIATDLVFFANQLGMHTVVIDPRRFFTENTQFDSSPDQLIQNWPAEAFEKIAIDPFTYAITLTHDPKIDDQALKVLLRSKAAYIGALGSRRTHAKRLDRLRAEGFDDTVLDRIHGPVGLSINAQTAQEIALSIIGEIVQIKNQFL